MIQAVIFDSDGTLFNTFELIAAAYEHVAQVYGLPAPKRSFIKQELGKPLPVLCCTFFPGSDVEKLIETNSTYVAANVMSSVAFEGLYELLSSLRACNLKMAILTSGNQKVYDILRHHDIADYFQSVVTYDRIMKPKPDSEGFLLACQECGVSPHEAIMIGDTYIDIETGQNAGALATIAVTHGFNERSQLEQAQPTYVAESL